MAFHIRDKETDQAVWRLAKLKGKGRRPAALNLSDRLAHACARELYVPLVRKVNNFPQTDITAG